MGARWGRMAQGGAEAGRQKIFWGLSERVIGACVEVHRLLGPGLLESAYETCLCHELSLRGIGFERQLALPVEYKGVQLEAEFRIDLVVEQRLLIELKSVAELLPIHSAQVLTYLRLAKLSVGLLVNFNTPRLQQGLRRLLLPADSAPPR